MARTLKPIFDKASKVGIALTPVCLALTLFTSNDKPAIAAATVFSVITITSIAGWAVCEIKEKKSKLKAAPLTPKDP